MKKIIIFLLCGIFSFQLCGCTDQQSADERREQRIKEIEATFEDDGVLQYCYDEVTDSYHISGKKQQIQNEFYIPLMFRGKKITETIHNAYLGSASQSVAVFTPKYNVEHLYFADNIELYYETRQIYANNLYFSHEPTTERVYENIFYLLFNNKKIFVQRKMFIEFEDSFSEANLLDKKQKHYKLEVDIEGESKIVQVANVVFYYNYEDEQGKVFLVDNKDGAFLITKPPYEPIREGYKFKGWYKEPECINAWDFEKDLTPELSYNEQGELIFKETSLYAKWEKN